MGSLFGASQNQTSAMAANQESMLSENALLAQANQNNQMLTEKSNMNNLVAARTAALTSDLGPTSATPYALNNSPTISTSELGDQSTPQTSRKQLLGT
jgi:hypothetical protein